MVGAQTWSKQCKILVWFSRFLIAVKVRLPMSSCLPAMGKENVLKHLSVCKFWIFHDFSLSHSMLDNSVTLRITGSFLGSRSTAGHIQNPHEKPGNCINCIIKEIVFPTGFKLQPVTWLSLLAQSLCPWWARTADRTWTHNLAASSPQSKADWNFKLHVLAGKEKTVST